MKRKQYRAFDTATITVRLPAPMKEQLRREAEWRNMNLSEYVLSMVAKYRGIRI